jgi:mitochondrial fission protein ELM1
MTDKDILRLLLLREKKPGHYRQVEGVALAFARIAPVAIARLDVHPRWFAPDEVRRLTLRLPFGAAADRLRLLYGIDAARLARPQIVVGSGRPTVAAGILLAEHFNADFIFSGWAKNYDRSRIALSLSNSPGHAGVPGVVYVPIPSTVDADRLPSPRPLANRESLRGASVALLVGGDAYDHRYTEEEWRALATFVAESARAFGVRWRISTSRRSPRSLSATFAAMLARNEIAEFIDYRSAGAGSADALLGADAIVVTADSRSMISEALAARRPVVAIRPRHAASNDEIEAVVTRRAIALLPLSELAPATFADALLAVRLPERDPRDLIAAALRPLVERAVAGAGKAA